MTSNRPIHSHPHPAGSAGGRDPGRASARPRQAAQLDRAPHHARHVSAHAPSSRALRLRPDRLPVRSQTFPGSKAPPSSITSASTASASGSSCSSACSRPSASSPVGTPSRPAARSSTRSFSSSRPPCSASSSRSTSCSTTASGSSRSSPWPFSSPCTAARTAPAPRSNSSSSPSFPPRRCWSPFSGSTRAPHTFNFAELQYQTASGVLPAGALFWVALAFLFAFAVKVPVFPLHGWLADTYNEAPVALAMVVAGKLGLYSMLRFHVGLFPAQARAIAPLLIALAVIGILYGACLALVQRDFWRLMAFAALSHLSLIVLAIYGLTFTRLGRRASIRSSPTASSTARSSCCSARSSSATPPASSTPTADSPPSCRAPPLISSSPRWP